MPTYYPAWAIEWGSSFQNILYLMPYNGAFSETTGRRVNVQSYPYGDDLVPVSFHDAGRKFTFSGLILASTVPATISEQQLIEQATEGLFRFYPMSHQRYNNCYLSGPDALQFDKYDAIQGRMGFSIAFQASDRSLQTVTAIGASPYDSGGALVTGVNSVDQDYNSFCSEFDGRVENTTAGNEHRFTLPGALSDTWTISKIRVLNSKPEPDDSSGSVVVRVASYGVGGTPGSSITLTLDYDEKEKEATGSFSLSGTESVYVYLESASSNHHDLKYYFEIEKA